MTEEHRGSSFGRLDELTPRLLAEGVVTRILTGSRMTLVYVELDRGVPVGEHAHDTEQIGVLLSGSIWFRIGGELRRQRAGETWSIPPGVPHGIDRTGPEGAALVEAFAPARTDYEALRPLPRRSLRHPFGMTSVRDSEQQETP
jgi:quercetin dioxygenase-like cupin family protein